MEEGATTGNRRASRKRAEIVAAAERLFLEQGYGATSMDGVAAAAGASKRTVYNHFPSKEELFRAVVEGLYEELHGAVAAPATGGDPRLALTTFATALLAHIARPEIRALVRLVIAEHGRFPEITNIFFAAGKEQAVARLAGWIAGEAASGRLRVPDATLAAQQFLGCLKESLFWPRVLGLQPLFPPETVITEAVTTFLTRAAPEAR